MATAATAPSTPPRRPRRAALGALAAALAIASAPPRAGAADPDPGPLAPPSAETASVAAKPDAARRTDSAGAISWAMSGGWEELGPLESRLARSMVASMKSRDPQRNDYDLVAAYRHANAGFLGLNASEFFVVRVSTPGSEPTPRDYRAHAARSRAEYEAFFKQGGGKAPNHALSTFEADPACWSATSDFRYGGRGVEGRREVRHDVMTRVGLYAFFFAIRKENVDETESDVAAILRSIEIAPDFEPRSMWSQLSWRDPPALGAAIGALIGVAALAGESIARRRRLRMAAEQAAGTSSTGPVDTAANG